MTTKTPKKKRRKSAAMKFMDQLIGEPMSFARLIESTRLAEEMSMTAFAERLGISVSHLNDIEKGRKFVSPERAADFAKTLGYSNEQYIRLALQDQLSRANLKFVVSLDAA
jgi:transcriptional regulator with XRE-family HTH domain